MPAEIETGALAERLRALAACRRCKCRSCTREGAGELHDHVCTQRPHCRETPAAWHAWSARVARVCREADAALRAAASGAEAMREALEQIANQPTMTESSTSDPWNDGWDACCERHVEIARRALTSPPGSAQPGGERQAAEAMRDAADRLATGFADATKGSPPEKLEPHFRVLAARILALPLPAAPEASP